MPRTKAMYRKYATRKKRARPRTRVDKKQNKRIRALEKKVASTQGWIDSVYTEATVNRTPQQIARGRQDSSALSSFFSLPQQAQLLDNDHTRIGRSIKALRVKGHLTISGRGSSAGYPPDSGSKSGKNDIRLLGVIYKTSDDYAVGLDQVLQNPLAIDTHPARAVDSFFQKQSLTEWKIWMDKRLTVPYTQQVSRVKFNVKVPEGWNQMVYDTNNLSDPETNIMVLYAMSAIRDNTANQCTIQAVYRCTFEK